MFPTTVWDLVRRAGAREEAALEEVAREYRAPVLEFLRSRARPADAEDLCQDVFLRLIRGDVFQKADPERGSFRGLLRTIAIRVAVDAARRRRELPQAEVDPPARPPDFDRIWALHMTERALARLRQESARSYDVLDRHLRGEVQDRQRLWVARNKLRALLRGEVARTCRTPAEVDEELRALDPYLGGRRSKESRRQSGPPREKRASR